MRVKKPNDTEIRACHPWLDQELALVKPRVVLCLGATAAQALLGKSFRVTRNRGLRLRAPFADAVFATVYPSAVLRTPGSAARTAARRAFVADQRKIARVLGSTGEREARRVARRVD